MCLLEIKDYYPFEVFLPKKTFFIKRNILMKSYATSYLSYLQLPQYATCFVLIIFE
jgi:hypothetical protein